MHADKQTGKPTQLTSLRHHPGTTIHSRASTLYVIVMCNVSIPVFTQNNPVKIEQMNKSLGDCIAIPTQLFFKQNHHTVVVIEQVGEQFNCSSDQKSTTKMQQQSHMKMFVRTNVVVSNVRLLQQH